MHTAKPNIFTAVLSSLLRVKCLSLHVEICLQSIDLKMRCSGFGTDAFRMILEIYGLVKRSWFHMISWMFFYICFRKALAWTSLDHQRTQEKIQKTNAIRCMFCPHFSIGSCGLLLLHFFRFQQINVYSLNSWEVTSISSFEVIASENQMKTRILQGPDFSLHSILRPLRSKRAMRRQLKK